jgi:hypothetical protein
MFWQAAHTSRVLRCDTSWLQHPVHQDLAQNKWAALFAAAYVAPALLPAAEAMQRRSTSKFRRRSADKPILTRAQYEAKLARERRETIREHREKVYILARVEALAKELTEIKTALASELAGQGAEAFTATAAAPSAAALSPEDDAAADARLEASCLALIPAAAAESAERCAGLNGVVTPKIQE